MPSAVERLNADCLCRTVDAGALAAALDRETGEAGFAGRLSASRPGLMAKLPIYLSADHADRMAEIIDAIERVARLPAYRQAVLAGAPQIARLDPGPIGVFMGYDFHLSPDGPKLIEINTNAGGALLNAHLAAAQRACCAEVEAFSGKPPEVDDREVRFIESFRAEWRRLGLERPLARIAITDDAPTEQFLYPEFQLFQRMFERHGIAAVIADAKDFVFRDGDLFHGGQRVDLVYNRLTDFALAQESHAALAEAYLARAVAITPNPRAHALFADKRNLALLTDAAALAGFGPDAGGIETLLGGIAATEVVTPARAEALWAERNHLFFKPAAGYGSKAAYRGDKITKKVWADILAGEYVAQALVSPSARGVVVDGAMRQLKADIRAYTYDGEVLLLAARLYQGQTTNMRTEGGGFAPVVSLDLEAAIKCDCL